MNTKGIPVFVAVFALLAAPDSARSQEPPMKTPDLAAEIEALKEGQKAIRADLAEIKSLLTPKPPPSPDAPVSGVKIDLTSAYVGGDRNATAFLIEYSDYQCSFCQQQTNVVMPEVDRDYIKTGKVRYAFRNFPLEDLHPLAFAAAEAVECAGAQGRFWQMHQLLFDNQKALSHPDLVKYAATLNLDASKFAACLDGRGFAEKIRKERAEGVNAGISGTPTILIGTAKPGDLVVTVTRMVVGAQPYAILKAVLDRVLSSKPEPADTR